MYVGIAVNPNNRFSSHRSMSAWFQQIRKITIEPFKTRAEAIKAERRAIKLEKPLHNLAHVEKKKAKYDYPTIICDLCDTDEVKKFYGIYWKNSVDKDVMEFIKDRRKAQELVEVHLCLRCLNQITTLVTPQTQEK